MIDVCYIHAVAHKMAFGNFALTLPVTSSFSSQFINRHSYGVISGLERAIE